MTRNERTVTPQYSLATEKCPKCCAAKRGTSKSYSCGGLKDYSRCSQLIKLVDPSTFNIGQRSLDANQKY